jgi:hypothetical protein
MHPEHVVFARDLNVTEQDVIDMKSPSCFAAGKVAALVSASPGLLGGVKSRLSLQVVLSKLGVLVAWSRNEGHDGVKALRAPGGAACMIECCDFSCCRS